jgi:hypothetical protein
MSQKPPSDQDNLEQDPVWDLLSRDAEDHPVIPSPWFAARTAALVTPRKRFFSPLMRWLLPVPLAGLAALAMLALHGGHGLGIMGTSGTYVSTEAEFEQHMDFLFASSE